MRKTFVVICINLTHWREHFLFQGEFLPPTCHQGSGSFQKYDRLNEGVLTEDQPGKMWMIVGFLLLLSGTEFTLSGNKRFSKKWKVTLEIPILTSQVTHARHNSYSGHLLISQGMQDSHMLI